MFFRDQWSMLTPFIATPQLAVTRSLPLSARNTLFLNQ
jgi:hypothetical protein